MSGTEKTLSGVLVIIFCMFWAQLIYYCVGDRGDSEQVHGKGIDMSFFKNGPDRRGGAGPRVEGVVCGMTPLEKREAQIEHGQRRRLSAGLAETRTGVRVGGQSVDISIGFCRSSGLLCASRSHSCAITEHCGGATAGAVAI